MNKTVLRMVQKWAKEIIAQAKEDAWMAFCASLGPRPPLSKLWAFATKIMNRGRRDQGHHPNPQIKARRLMEDFAMRASNVNISEETKELQLSLQPVRQEKIKNAIETPDDVYDHAFSPGELLNALNGCRDTAPGSDGIKACMAKHMGVGATLGTLNLINHIYSSHKVPSSWLQSDYIPLPKPHDPTSMRPIALLKFHSKLMEYMAKPRLEAILGPNPCDIYGYTEFVGSIDAVATIMLDISEGLSVGLCGILLVADVTKAFELSSREVILELLVDAGVKGHLLAYADQILTNRSARVIYQGAESDYQALEKGIAQGGVLSPLFFYQIMKFIVTRKYTGSKVGSFADDLKKLTLRPKHEVLAVAQTSTDELNYYMKLMGLGFNGSKCKAMCFGMAVPTKMLMIDGVEIEWVSSHLILGVVLDRQLKMDKHIEYLAERIQKRLNYLKAVTNPKAGANGHVLHKIYISAIRSLIDYSAICLVMASENSLEKLEKLQNAAMRLILGAPQWTKIINMLQETGLVSVKDRLRLLQVCYTVKTVRSPRNTLLQESLLAALPEAHQGSPKTVRNLLSVVTNETLEGNSLAEDGPYRMGREPLLPWIELPGTFILGDPSMTKKGSTSIALKSTYEKEVNALNNRADVICYTDGSVDEEGRAGGGVVAVTKTRGNKLQRLCFRASNGASTTQTELKAIQIALTCVNRGLEINENHTTVIHTDSKSAIEAIQIRKPKDNIDIITDIQYELISYSCKGGMLTINYIPSHVGLWGNEEADNLAKAGTRLPQVTRLIAPSISQNKLNAKAAIRTAAREVYKEESKSSESVAWHQIATKDIPAILKLNRKTQTSLHKLRLNYKSHWEITNSQPEKCCHCKMLVVCQPVLHYVLECSKTHQFFGPKLDVNNVDASLVAATRVNTAQKRMPQLVEVLEEFPVPR